MEDGSVDAEMLRVFTATADKIEKETANINAFSSSPSSSASSSYGAAGQQAPPGLKLLEDVERFIHTFFSSSDAKSLPAEVADEDAEESNKTTVVLTAVEERLVRTGRAELPELLGELERRIQLLQALMRLCDREFVPSATKRRNYRVSTTASTTAPPPPTAAAKDALRRMLDRYSGARQAARDAVQSSADTARRLEQASEGLSKVAARTAAAHATTGTSSRSGGGGAFSGTTSDGVKVINLAVRSSSSDIFHEHQHDECDDGFGGDEQSQLISVPVHEGIDVEEAQRIAEEVRELRELNNIINECVVEHGEKLTHAQQQATEAEARATEGRLQLTAAARYKAIGAALTGALLGGVIGGPIGMLAGAKSVATVGGACAIGSLGGAVTSKAITTATAQRTAEVDDHYADRVDERGKK